MRPARRQRTLTGRVGSLAVPCRRCGRQYDVALFQFGRTISCACGARVGIEPRVRSADRGDRSWTPRFVADAMLGRLARWLRLLGLDCAYDAGLSDAAIVRLALEEGRTLLTRDQRLPDEWWIEDLHVVRAVDVREQLAEVVERFDLVPAMRVLTRCSECNEPLEDACGEEVAGRVPERVLASHDAFSRCPSCGRVYWEGTHAARIRTVAESLRAAFH